MRSKIALRSVALHSSMHSPAEPIRRRVAAFSDHHPARTAKRCGSVRTRSFCLRRRRDSNSRDLSAYALSKRAHSTAMRRLRSPHSALLYIFSQAILADVSKTTRASLRLISSEMILYILLSTDDMVL